MISAPNANDASFFADSPKPDLVEERASGSSSVRPIKMKDPAPNKKMIAIWKLVNWSPSARMRTAPTMAGIPDNKFQNKAWRRFARTGSSRGMLVESV